METKGTAGRPLPYFLSDPHQALGLLPDGPLRDALRNRDFDALQASDSRVARSLGAWYNGFWVRAYTEADIELLEHGDPKVAELKRQLVAQGPIYSRKSPRPTLSACLIVRDNEATLERALTSVQPIADEIVIVDTGSTDSTVEIAHRFTDQVGFYAWTEDFSAARNAVLALATQDWVLSIDSDEWLETKSHEVVRACLHDSSCIYSPLQRGAGNTTAFTNPRLFPRRADARWRFALHEQITFDNPQPMLISMTAFNIPTDESPKRALKGERNLRIIEHMKSGDEESRQLALGYEALERYRLDPSGAATIEILTRACAELRGERSGLARRLHMILATIYGQSQQWNLLEPLALVAESSGLGGLWSRYAKAKCALARGDAAAVVLHARDGLAFRDFEGAAGAMRQELAAMIRHNASH